MAIQVGDLLEGGIVFYVDDTGNNGLISALNDQQAAQWAPTDIGFLIGANDELIGTGKTNNDKITAHFGNGNYCAKICEDLIISGLSGWYLPSKQELQLMLVYDFIIGTGSFFTRPSSTEVNSTHIACVNFTPPQENVNSSQLKNGFTQQGFIFRAIKTYGVISPVNISTLDLPTKPDNEMVSSTAITETTAIVTANFIDSGSTPINLKGIVYNIIGNPYFGNSSTNVISPNNNLGEEDFNLSGLFPGITYYVRSYAKNDLGIKYGSEIQFTTIGDPVDIVITTEQAINVTGNSAILKANVQIVTGGGVQFDELGFYISVDQTFSTFQKALVPGDVGEIEKQVTGLLSETEYFYKGYGLTTSDTGQHTQFGNVFNFTTAIATPAILNPEAPLRTAYITALSAIQPTWAKRVPKNITVPKKYIIIGTQTKNPTEKGKGGCMEWLCTITVDIYNVNPTGFASPINNDNIEEQVINVIESGIIVDGFMVKSIDFIQSTDLSIETSTESIERRIIIYEHWLAQL